MRGKDLLDKMEFIDPAYIEAADTAASSGRRRLRHTVIAVSAACLCLFAAGALALSGRPGANTVQQWKPNCQAAEYFRFCGQSTAVGSETSKACLDTSAIPYDETRWFSDSRSLLEEEEVIPIIDTHPLFKLAGRYLGDGSLYCVEIFWHRRDLKGTEHYSDLTVTAGFQEIPRIQDCIYIEIDENGCVLEPAVTVTERDGISIIATGRENTEKTLTFQNDSGWYQITGSWNDDYEAVVQLLDWFWEHPLDFSRFAMEAGDNYIHSSLAETPDAFAAYLPDFEAFGFIHETDYVSLKNGVPVRFEGHYVAHVSEEAVQDQSYYDLDGYTTMHWCITTEPDYYDLAECAGRLEDLTEEQVTDILTNQDTKIRFLQGDCLVSVYPGNAAEAWELIASLQER